MQDTSTIINNLQNYLNSLVDKAQELYESNPEQAKFLCQSALNLATIIVHEAGIEINWKAREAMIMKYRLNFQLHPFVENLIKGKQIPHEETQENMHIIHEYMVIIPTRVSANGEGLWFEKIGARVGGKEYFQSFDMMLDEYSQPENWVKGQTYIVYNEMFDGGQIKFKHAEGFWLYIQQLDESTAEWVSKRLARVIVAWKKKNKGNKY